MPRWNPGTQRYEYLPGEDPGVTRGLRIPLHAAPQVLQMPPGAPIQPRWWGETRVPPYRPQTYEEAQRFGYGYEEPGPVQPGPVPSPRMKATESPFLPPPGVKYAPPPPMGAPPTLPTEEIGGRYRGRRRVPIGFEPFPEKPPRGWDYLLWLKFRRWREIYWEFRQQEQEGSVPLGTASDFAEMISVKHGVDVTTGVPPTR